MRAQWLQRSGSEDLILFYGGWAVGAGAVHHLHGGDDVLVLDDYRDETLPGLLLRPYRRLHVIAWSMGVAVAARHLDHLAPARATAICGAPDPRAAIGPQTYDATAASLTAESLQRFARRAGADLPEQTEPGALAQELQNLALRDAAPAAAFTHIIAGRRDRIFPQRRMAEGWPAREITWLDCGHNPFPLWRAWSEIR
ncbi:pimeloyl-ACP methyl esterase BioG family protein [Rhodobacter sp. 24-YEA-8]|uniref:pimeloyl-ACP methyl esterase BioG family protein n=1 Tax=Rhodobacter sp. 24-YEA-8 TaxID=1884310 RepID=UPI00089B0D3E|nr:pimeloyl-ACP methyl esterase BioG family protein [Rhodobacter sp. 24-YEA-8]SED77305.1 biotin synthesis protein BioG [Rhodobacter sp. 24-YEA-8]